MMTWGDHDTQGHLGKHLVGQEAEGERENARPGPLLHFPLER